VLSHRRADGQVGQRRVWRTPSPVGLLAPVPPEALYGPADGLLFATADEASPVPGDGTLDLYETCVAETARDLPPAPTDDQPCLLGRGGRGPAAPSATWVSVIAYEDLEKLAEGLVHRDHVHVPWSAKTQPMCHAW